MLKPILAALMLLGLTACGSSAPENAADFYKGKNVTYIVATNAGGGYDAYARLIAKHMTKYLGADNIIINNVPGAGHIVGTNTLWKAKPDGLTIGTFTAGLMYNQLLHRQTMQFDLQEFTWIGKAAGEPRSIVVGTQCPIQSMQDLLANKEVIKFSSAGIGSAAYTDTKLLAEALQLNIEVLPGFDGTEGEMSMMRGEVCGQFGTTSSLQPFVDAGYGKFIMTVGGTIEGVPNVWEFVHDEDAKKLVSLIEAMAQLGRITAAPPGLPKERFDILVAAYKAAVEDPELLAEAKKMALPIETAYGEEVKQLVVNALNQPPETVVRLAQIVNMNQE